jgi:hypothetical protein
MLVTQVRFANKVTGLRERQQLMAAIIEHVHRTVGCETHVRNARKVHARARYIPVPSENDPHVVAYGRSLSGARSRSHRGSNQDYRAARHPQSACRAGAAP